MSYTLCARFYLTLLLLGLSFRTNVRNLKMIVEISPFGRNDKRDRPDSKGMALFCPWYSLGRSEPSLYHPLTPSP